MAQKATKIRCEYCHIWIDPYEHKAHIQEHLRLRPDGQQNEYVTLPPEEWYQGTIEEAPKVYRHLRCGCCTGMPVEIIRTYLKDPFAYSDFTYCSGCQTHVPCREFVWVETGENMQAYNNRLRRNYLGWRKTSARDIGKTVGLMGRLLLYTILIGFILLAFLSWLWIKANTEP